MFIHPWDIQISIPFAISLLIQMVSSMYQMGEKKLCHFVSNFARIQVALRYLFCPKLPHKCHKFAPVPPNLRKWKFSRFLTIQLSLFLAAFYIPVNGVCTEKTVHLKTSAAIMYYMARPYILGAKLMEKPMFTQRGTQLAIKAVQDFAKTWSTSTHLTKFCIMWFIAWSRRNMVVEKCLKWTKKYSKSQLIAWKKSLQRLDIGWIFTIWKQSHR